MTYVTDTDESSSPASYSTTLSTLRRDSGLCLGNFSSSDETPRSSGKFIVPMKPDESSIIFEKFPTWDFSLSFFFFFFKLEVKTAGGFFLKLEKSTNYYSNRSDVSRDKFRNLNFFFSPRRSPNSISCNFLFFFFERIFEGIFPLSCKRTYVLSEFCQSDLLAESRDLMQEPEIDKVKELLNRFYIWIVDRRTIFFEKCRYRLVRWNEWWINVFKNKRFRLDGTCEI